MKKLFALITTIALFSTSVLAEINMNYVTDGMTTTAENYSLAGSSDPNYPLYINGEEINRSSEGYFSFYAPLAEGENVFNFENTSDSKTYTITRTAAEATAPGEDSFNAVDLVGRVNRNHPTVRSNPDESNYDLITPFVQGTLLHIVAENSEYYETANGSYIYKESVDIVEDEYGENYVMNIMVGDDFVTINMDRATEFDVDFTENGLNLKLYDTKNAFKVGNPAFGRLSLAPVSESPVEYSISFSQPDFVGYMAYYNGGEFTIKLNESSQTNPNSLEGVDIVLDAGHGGTDSGTLGLGSVYEKTVNLNIVKYLETYLQEKGANVILTRSDDTYVSLGDRTSLIQETMPDISVSIHCNSRNEWQDFNELKGTLNLYTYDTPSQFVEKLTNYMENTKYEKQNLALTRTTVCPAVLIETGYMSNPEEYEYLIKDENQKAMAEKIGYAIEQYFVGEASDTYSVEIFHTTDIHGNAQSAEGYLGYSKIYEYVENARAEDDNVILLDSGDTLEGLPFANFTKGESIVPILNYMGYDAMTLGNHEFSYSNDVRSSLLSEISVPVVSANITDDGGNLIYNEYVIEERGNVKVGIFGLTTETTKNSVLSENVENVQFKDVEESARTAVKDLKAEGCDYIIALTHLGSADTEGNVSCKLAENVEGIDLVLDGHSHVINEGTTYGDTLLVASGYYGNAFSHITVDFKDGEVVSEQVDVVTADELAEATGDEGLNNIISETAQKLDEFFGQVVATTDITWDGTAALNRTEPTLLGTFVAESYRDIAGADIGIVNGGGVRQTVEAGEVTKEDIYSVQPFNNIISTYNLSGSDIIATFKHSLEQRGSGSYLQFSGLKAEYDSSTNEVISITFADGSPIEADKQYVVATSSYVATNDRFPEFKANGQLIADFGVDYEITLSYIEKYGMTPVEILIKDVADEATTEATTEVTTEATTEATTETSTEISTETSTETTTGVVLREPTRGGRVKSTTTTTTTEATTETTTEETTEETTEATTEAPMYENPFVDVNSSDWFYENVIEANKMGLFNGVTVNTFEPYLNLNRAMVVTVLYRIEGSPQVNGISNFTDVANNSYYYNAVKWAEDNNIVKGYSQSEFAPSDAVTREQLAAIINRYAQYKGYYSDSSSDLSVFSDGNNISSWARDNVSWAVSQGIFKGRADGTFDPKGTTTRAEAATVFTRLYDVI